MADTATPEELRISDRAVVEDSGEFYFLGQINDQTAERLILALNRFASSKQRKSAKPDINITISSPGGVVSSFLDMYSVIQHLKHERGYKVITRCTSIAASCGALLMQAGTERVISPYGQMVLHDVSGMIYGTTDERERSNERIDMLRLSCAQVLAQNNTAGHTDPQWWIENYMRRGDHHLSAEACLELGLVDRILPAYGHTT